MRKESAARRSVSRSANARRRRKRKENRRAVREVFCSLERLEERCVLSGEQWGVVFRNLSLASNLEEQAQRGQQFLQHYGIENVQVVQAIDLEGGFVVEATDDSSEEMLEDELKDLPGFVIIKEYEDFFEKLPSGTFEPGPPGDDVFPGPDDGSVPEPGTWTSATLAPASIGTMILLSDGTVMAQGGGVSNTWFKLTPNASGSYLAGSWSSLAPMSTQRLYYASNILTNGKLFLLGGEYSGPSGTGNWTNTGEMYDPEANSWSSIAPFPQTAFGDGQSEILPDGRVLAGYLSGPQTYIYDPATNTWSTGGSKLRNDRNNEETWNLLPDGSVLTYDVWSSNTDGVAHSQRYVPSTNTWVDSGNLPALLSSSALGFEMGPALLLPDGRVFMVGANNNTALYNPSTNSWAAGPTLPANLGADDAPGAILPNGHVIFAVDTSSPKIFTGPTRLFDFNPTTNTVSELTGQPGFPTQLTTDLNHSAYQTRMLMLPTGQLLLAPGGGSSRVWVYTPDGSAQNSWRPTISSIVNNGDGTYTLNGTQLNGISEGASYGDDAEMSSNYPIVQLTSTTTGNVYYARTYNWSSTGVATGSKPVSAQFELADGLPDDSYSLSVIANGIASAPVILDGTIFVLSSTPASGAIVSTKPTSYVINFTDPVDLASLQPSDLRVNGAPATGVTPDSSHTTATFTFAVNPVVNQGLQTMAIAAGSITKDGAPTIPIAAFSSSFRYDVTALTVTSTTPAAGLSLTVPGTLDLNFNEAFDPASVQASDLQLSGAGTGTASDVTFLNSNTTARFTISGTFNEAALIASLAAGSITDVFGNPNTVFSASYSAEIGTVQFPVPLLAKNPLGSLVYDPLASASISPAGDSDSFTINVDAGQQITVIVHPTVSTLRPTATLKDPANATLATATPALANQDAILQSVPTTTAGVYTVTVTGAASTVGSYTVQVILNAAEELERHTGQPTNGTAATAQNIVAAFQSLGGTASRTAVLGTVSSSSDLDFYRFSLTAGDTVSIALKTLSGSGQSFTLRDSGGVTVLASGGTGATNLDRVLSDFIAPTTSDYFLVVAGTSANSTYDAVITRNAEFNTESNDTTVLAQEVLSRQTGGDQYALGYVGFTGDLVDLYKVNLAAGATLTAQTATPAGGAGEFANGLDPQLRVLNAAGAQVAIDDNSSGDGKNALVSFTNSGAAGVFYVEVASTTNGTITTAGEYILRINNNTVTKPPFLVTTTTPANGAFVRTATSIVVNLNHNYLNSSVAASDLRVDGVNATAVTLTTGNTITFTAPAGLLNGLHTITIAAGAITDVQGTGLSAYTGTFTLDTVPPKVTATSIAPGGIVAPGTLSYVVTFSEPMLTSNLSTDDFSLHGNFRQASGVKYTASSSSFTSSTQLTLTYTNLPDDSYTLTLTAGSTGGSNFTDLAGNALDGEFSGTFPSGNNVAGGNFLIDFSLDLASEAYATPLTMKQPLGSLIYDPSLSRVIAYSGDTDTFTLALDANQTVTVLVTPTTAGLQPSVTLLSPSGATLGSATASAAGQAALLQTIPAATSGTYSVVVGGLGSSTGLYTAQVTLNAALEVEQFSIASDDTQLAAQNIANSFLTLQTTQTTVQRAAVIGGNSASAGAFSTTNFEGGLSGYTINNNNGIAGYAPGLWHLTTRRSTDSGHSAITSFYYGSEATGNYDTPDQANAGNITSSGIVLPSSGPITLSFNYMLQTEGAGSGFDVASVQVSNNGGSSFTTVGSSDDGSLALTGTWTTASFDLSSFAGQTILLRFDFNTGDSISNGFEGWYVDDVQLSAPGGGSWTDYYSFPATAGDVVSVALKHLSGSGASVFLEDASGVLAAGAPGATNYENGISSYAMGASGTYYLRVSGSAAATYSLVVTRNAGFDTEANDTYATAQPLDGNRGVLGAVSSQVVPSIVGGVDGSTSSNSPFNIGAAGTPSMRYQQIYASTEFSEAGTITALRFRRNQNELPFSTPGVNLKINLGYAATTVATFSATFANNVGASTTTVLDNPSLTLQSTVQSVGNPNPFDVVINLSTPFFYDPSRGDLLLDIFMRNSPVTKPFDVSAGGTQTVTRRVSANNVAGTIGGVDSQFTGLVTQFDMNLAREDWYSFDVTDTASGIRLETSTPADGANQFVNLLNPHLELYGPTDSTTPLLSGAALADGRNEVIQYVPTITGTYRVRVTADNNTSGEYLLTRTFVADITPPHVVATSVAPGSTIASGALTYTVTFSEPMKVSNLSSDDFSMLADNRAHVNGTNQASFLTSSFSFNADGTVLTLVYSGLPDDVYTLTLVAGASGGLRFTDAAGNALDGEFTGALPSGDGLAGGDFAVGFTMDNASEGLLTPLESAPPIGSLVYDPSFQRVIAFAGDTDSFTISLDAGQRATVLVTPLSFGLQPTFQLKSGSTVLGTASAPVPGESALLQSISAATSGTYTIVVNGVGNTTGLYSIQLFLNAALEAANVGLGSNKTRATAQELDSVIATVQTAQSAAGRGAVLGGLASGTLTLNSIDSGFWDDSGLHTAINKNYVTGKGTTSTSRNYVVFDLTTVSQPITAAQLKLGGGTFSSTDGVETYALFDISDLNAVRSDGAGRLDIYDDLGTGTIYGSRNFQSSDGGTLTTTNLIDAGVAALNAALGGPVALGGAITTINPTGGSQLMFGNTGATFTKQLILTIPTIDSDYYSFTLSAAQPASVALKNLTGGGTSIAIQNSSGVTLASGITPGPGRSLDQVINNFVAPADGTYYIVVSANSAATYDLVVTRDAAFDTEPNDSYAAAQLLDSNHGALGAIYSGVVPSSVASTEGNTNTSTPFNIGASSTSRYQQIYANSEFSQAGMITAIRFRRNGGVGHFETSGINVKINLGYAATTVATLSSTFTNNVGPGATTVLDTPSLTLASGDAVSTPNALDVVIPLSTPFFYDPSQGDLLLDIFMRSGPSTSLFDAAGLGQTTVTRRVFATGSGTGTTGVNATTGTLDTQFTGLVTQFDMSPPKEDWYSFDVTDLSREFRLETSTPADGSNQFVNNFNPHIELYGTDPMAPLALGTSLADGRNEFILYQPLMAGTYRVRVTGDAGTAGEYFLTRSTAPRIVASSIAPGALLNPDSFVIRLTFSEPMLADNLSGGDFTLHGKLLNVDYVQTGALFNAGGTMVILTYDHLPDDDYSLTLFPGTPGGTNFTDVDGTPLDGEFTGTFPTGDGSAGGNFVLNFSMQPDSEAFPFAAEPPAGSLIYDPLLRRAIVPAGDTDTFTVPVDPGQTIALLATPNSAALQLVVQLIDPSGAILGSATAAGAGQSVVLPALAATSTTPGTYKVMVNDAGSATGYYKLQVVLNAALESPGAGLGGNKSRDTAQSLDSSFIDLPAASASASRGAVIGSVGLITLGAIDDGWWSGIGNHTASNKNYIVGQTSANTFHNFFVFDLATVSQPIAGAELRLFVPEGGKDGDDPETLSLFDVSTPLSVLRASGSGRTDIFDDLGAGTFYGSQGFIELDEGRLDLKPVPLNAAGVAALNAALDPASDKLIALGGAVTSIVGTATQDIFASSGLAAGVLDTRQLAVTVEADSDYYSLTLAAGQKAMVALTNVAGGGATIAIQDASGATLATGTAGTGDLDQVIGDFRAPASGTYYIVVSTLASAANYNLVVTRDAVLETENNDTPATAQPLAASVGVLGALDNHSSMVPPQLAQLEANGSNGFPFNLPIDPTAASMRYQQIYSHTEFAEPGTITALRFRRNGGTLPFTTSGIDVKINLSQAATTVETVSATFADNVPSSGVTTVYDSATDGPLTLSSSATGRRPYAFDIVINLTHPFTYDPSQGDLLLDVFMRNALATAQFEFSNAPEQTTMRRVYATNVNATTGTRSTPNYAGLLTQFDFAPDDDWYAIDVTNTASTIRLDTATPADGPGQFVNMLNPRIELYDPSNVLVASGTTLADARNEFIQYPPLTTGAYKVRVMAEEGTSGEYFLTKNVSPVLSSLSVPPINENDVATLTGTIDDPDTVDSHTVVIHWGDGSGDTTLNLPPGVLTFTAPHYYAEEGEYPIGVSVTDNHAPAATGGATAIVIDPNITATGGLAFSLSEGPASVRTVSGAVATFIDPAGYETDADYSATIDWGDGSVVAGTISSGAVLGSHTYANEQGSYSIIVSLQHEALTPQVVTNTVAVANVAPTATPNQYTTQQAAAVSGNVIGDDTGSGIDSDPAGVNDPLTISGYTAPASGTLTLAANGQFTYTPDSTFAGTDTFNYTISDGDGGYATATVTIVVAAAPAGSILTVPDSCWGGTALLISGTSAGDTIVVEPGSSAATLKITYNGISSTVARPSGRIIVTGRDGDDDIQIAGAIANPVWLYGDAGNDRLNAGNGGSLLFGGDGDDQLLGGSGRDVMIGGEGADHLVGNSNGDILVASGTTIDARWGPGHEEFWCAVLAEWNSARLFDERVQNLRSGPTNLLSKVQEDMSPDAIDFLNGSAGDDWLILLLTEDKVSGQTEASN